MRMLKQTGKKKKRAQELVFKPYLKGRPLCGDTARMAVKVLAHYAVFLLLFLVTGTLLNASSPAVAWISNLAVIFLCASFLFSNGAREGENQVALGEIAYNRREAGKPVDKGDLAKCFHPAKGFCAMLLGLLPLILVAAAFALRAQKQVYSLQVLPEWVASFEAEGDVLLPLSYYQTAANMTVMGFLRVIVRLMIYPFVSIARMYGGDATYLVERLSPLLVCLPALGYPLGYLTGPRSRAMVHGNIKTSNKRILRQRNRAIRAKRQRAEKKNELI